jgi:flagellar FliL protein
MADQAAAPAGPPKDIMKIVGMIVAALNVVISGGGAYLVYNATLGHKSPVVYEEELRLEYEALQKELQQEPIFYTMEVFNTNLEGLPRRFIRVEMSVEMYDKDGFEELVTLGGESRDTIVRILSSKQFPQIETVQGKLNLKNEIIAHLNSTLDRGVVKNIYFTKFQVQ